MALDIDNICDMTLMGLWAPTFIVSILGLFPSGGWKASVPSREAVPQQGSTAPSSTTSASSSSSKKT
ncbi:MAG TPA: hypothetical protein VFF30_05910 [Nitrososphaerales archaeon]|nr:hypothetical protein [Nitrososphaerales archaeon]